MMERASQTAGARWVENSSSMAAELFAIGLARSLAILSLAPPLETSNSCSHDVVDRKSKNERQQPSPP